MTATELFVTISVYWLKLPVYCTRETLFVFLRRNTFNHAASAECQIARPGSGNNNNRVELLCVRLECFLSLDHTARLFLITFNAGRKYSFILG